MSWTRSSKSVTLVVLVAVALAAVGGAAALSVTDEGVPAESRVGEQVNATITIEDPFVGTSDQWTLEATTELRNATWSITILQQGETVADDTYGKRTFSRELDADNGGDTIRLTVKGDTPPVTNYTYEPEETYTLYDLNRVVGDNTEDINSTAVHHYTNKSREARNAIRNATQAINGSSSQEARTQLNRSISAYNNGNFPNAISLAQDAKNTAQKAEQSAQRTQLILMGVGGLVVLLLLVGGIYYWQSQKDDYGKLQ